MSSIRALLFMLLITKAAESAEVTKVSIQTHDRKDFRGSVTLAVDGKNVCNYTFKGTDKDENICVIDLPKKAREFSVSGEMKWNDWQDGPMRAKGTMRWKIIDLAPMVRSLRNTGDSYGRRLNEFIKSKSDFDRANVALYENMSVVSVEVSEKDKTEDVVAAEKRLGYHLPTEFKSLLTEAGQLSIGDSSTFKAENMKNAYDQMIEDWETPDDAMRELSTKVVTLLKSSTILFTEVGDGYGALLYHSSGESRCGNSPAYWYVHQDTINDPDLLLRTDGKCKNFTEAMIWIFGQFALMPYEDSLEPVLLIDHSSIAIFPLQIFPELDPKAFSFDLRPVWDRFE